MGLASSKRGRHAYVGVAAHHCSRSCCARLFGQARRRHWRTRARAAASRKATTNGRAAPAGARASEVLRQGSAACSWNTGANETAARRVVVARAFRAGRRRSDRPTNPRSPDDDRCIECTLSRTTGTVRVRAGHERDVETGRTQLVAQPGGDIYRCALAVRRPRTCHALVVTSESALLKEERNGIAGLCYGSVYPDHGRPSVS